MLESDGFLHVWLNLTKWHCSFKKVEKKKNISKVESKNIMNIWNIHSPKWLSLVWSISIFSILFFECNHFWVKSKQWLDGAAPNDPVSVSAWTAFWFALIWKSLKCVIPQNNLVFWSWLKHFSEEERRRDRQRQTQQFYGSTLALVIIKGHCDTSYISTALSSPYRLLFPLTLPKLSWACVCLQGRVRNRTDKLQTFVCVRMWRWEGNWDDCVCVRGKEEQEDEMEL